MLFILWFLANAGFVWGVGKIDTNNVSDPIGTSWLIFLAWIAMNAVFGGVWIWG